MRLVFAGTPDIAVPSLDALVNSGRHEVVAVLTNPDRPAGRGRALHRSPVAKWADEHGIQVLQPERTTDLTFLAQFSAFNPECCPVVAYGKILQESLLTIPQYGWVNAHFSLLPAWRGAAPIQAAIASGDKITGVTTFRLDKGMDTGPILGHATDRISSTDTAESLSTRLAHSAAQLLVATMDGLASGTLLAIPQDHNGVTYSEKFTAEDARVNWSLPASIIDRRLRAFTPFPGPWTLFGDTRLKLGIPSIVSSSEVGSSAAGTVTEEKLLPGHIYADKHRVLVGTATDALKLSTVQPQGKKQMAATDWARGAHLSGNQVFS